MIKMAQRREIILSAFYDAPHREGTLINNFCLCTASYKTRNATVKTTKLAVMSSVNNLLGNGQIILIMIMITITITITIMIMIIISFLGAFRKLNALTLLYIRKSRLVKTCTMLFTAVVSKINEIVNLKIR